MKQKNITWSNVLPVCTLLIVLIVFSIISKGRILTGQNIQTVLDQSLTVMIGGMGMIFVLSHGGIDLAVGSTACVAVFIAAKAAMPYGVISVFLVAILVGTLTGLLIGVFSAKFKVPSFMVTVAMQTGLRGIANFFSASSGIVVMSPDFMKLNTLKFKIPFMIILLIVMTYIFEYTKIGIYSKAIGENELCSKISGINVIKIKCIDFMISGALAGITGVFMMFRTGGANNMLGKGFEMRVIMALLLGSVPVVGGMDSKMFKVVIGALTVLSLENGLSVSGISGGLYQLIEGIMLVVVCVITASVKVRAILHDEKMALQQQKAVE